MIDLQGASGGGRPSIQDFNEFLEEIVVGLCVPEGKGESPPRPDAYGKSIPLMAIPFEQMAVVYPVRHISTLMRRAEPQPSRTSGFLDLSKSELSSCSGSSSGNDFNRGQTGQLAKRGARVEQRPMAEVLAKCRSCRQFASSQSSDTPHV